MFIAALSILIGFVLLVWSADKFVDGAAATARHAGMPSLLIGMVIVGFGTSAPEMVVSAMAALDGNPNLALGNAVGSNIVNIGLVLGVTALIAPIMVHSNIIRKEMPILLLITLAFGAILLNNEISYMEAVLLLGGFFALIGWSIFSALKTRKDTLKDDIEKELQTDGMTLPKAITWLVVGLLLLILSSRILVWGAVNIATSLGISDLIVGLTIVAIGTSLPELAASVIAAKKGEHDIAIGNVVGSNMFNLLAVVGIAGVITPISNLDPQVLTRDWATMTALTIALFVMAYGFGKKGKVGRAKGIFLLTSYIMYNLYLVFGVMSS
ncbi:MAG: calcium/sodium antiporter [Sulfurimonas sp.]|uniref:calcium/sodium antiporter n=1 Tax=Sulfurimonas sp. TaxID=2022749 RepID=UPI0026003642|nr:calcium/sodium antiporter [Sulfurimonas sp.]MCK9455218.1 calcium/sodium antiporter [Sulfurimonas sp.]